VNAGRARPEPFLRVVTSDLNLEPILMGLCAGFEASEWRAEQLARHLFEWLPDFAFTYGELESFNHGNAAEFLARAAKAVYESDRYEHRGEFGELLLHAILRQEYGSEPAVSKVFFKDTANATVHGFDAVHVVPGADGQLELWLGEVKFYGNVGDAMTAVVKELHQHTDRDWLRSEFLAVTNKVDPAWPHASALQDLIHRNRSMDDIVERLHLPVLVTYDSPAVAAADRSDADYDEAFEAEVREHQRRFARRRLPAGLVIHLLLVPLANKQRLIAALDTRLRTYRGL
jgi:hypothetical protein